MNFKFLKDIFSPSARAAKRLKQEIESIDPKELEEAISHFNAYSILYNEALDKMIRGGQFKELEKQLEDLKLDTCENMLSISANKRHALIQSMVKLNNKQNLSDTVQFVNQSPPEIAAVSDIFDLEHKIKMALITHQMVYGTIKNHSPSCSRP